MHGGAFGSGAPRGNKNAFKHGTYTREAVEQRLELRKQIEEVRELLRNVSHLTRGSIGNDN
jgi:glucans biosynthesis protein